MPRGVWIVWRKRGYWLREEMGRILLFNEYGRKDPSYELCPVGPTPEYDFAPYSVRTGKRMPGVFHRYLVQQKGPNPFQKVPRWFSPDHYAD